MQRLYMTCIVMNIFAVFGSNWSSQNTQCAGTPRSMEPIRACRSCGEPEYYDGIIGDSFPKSTGVVEIPVERVPCRSDPNAGPFRLSDKEACARWRQMMSYYAVKNLKCESVVTNDGDKKTRCTPNFLRRKGVNTYVHFEDLKENGIGVKIDYRGMSAAMKDLTGCGIIIGVIVMFVLACKYCPSIPDTQPCDDDGFASGVVWGHMLSDDSMDTSWNVSNDDCVGGWGLVD